MKVLLRYKSPLRRFFSQFIPIQVRVFGIDAYNKPLGCQKLLLNFVYDIGSTKICLAGKRPKPGSANPFIDLNSVDKFNRDIEILDIIERKNNDQKEPSPKKDK